MKRYFYSNRISAEWMAATYGMQFISGRGSPLGYSGKFFTLDCPEGEYLGEFYFVHPDSLHLLEPREGDGVEFDRWYWERRRDDSVADAAYQSHFGRVLLFKNKRPDGGDWMQISSAGIGWDDNYGGRFSLPFKIILRDGKPFHWPETEPTEEESKL